MFGGWINDENDVYSLGPDDGEDRPKEKGVWSSVVRNSDGPDRPTMDDKLLRRVLNHLHFVFGDGVENSSPSICSSQDSEGEILG